MRKYVLFFLCISVFSCTTQKTTLSSFFTVYKREWVGNIYPSYIVLRAQPKIFEIYAPGIYASTVGEWNTINDTLFLFPKYEYYANDNKMHMHKIALVDSTVTSIPQQYIIKKDRIIDVTDYSVVSFGIFNNENVRSEYKLLLDKETIDEYYKINPPSIDYENY